MVRVAPFFDSQCILLSPQGWWRKWAPYMGALSAARWTWSGRGLHTLRCRVLVAGWAWSLHVKQIWNGNC